MRTKPDSVYWTERGYGKVYCIIVLLYEWMRMSGDIMNVRSDTVIRPGTIWIMCAAVSNECLFIYIRVTLPHRKDENQIKFLFVSNLPEYAHRAVHFGRIRWNRVPGWRLWHVFQFLWKRFHWVCATVKRLLNGCEFFLFFPFCWTHSIY